MTRSIWVKLHRVAGLCLALPLAVLGISGSIIVFDAELDQWLNPDLFHVTTPGAPSLGPTALIARIEHDDPRLRVTYLALDPATRKGSVAYVAARDGQSIDFDEVFIDPVSGHINGNRMWGACCFEAPNFVPFMYKLHNRLLLPIDLGRPLNGIIAIAWTLLMVVGLWLTVPAAGQRLRRWLQTATTLSAGSTQHKWLSWHRVTGLWLLPVLLVVALTGIGLGLEDGMTSIVNRVSSLSEPPTVQAPERDASFTPSHALALAQRTVQIQGIELPPAYISIPEDAGYYRVRFGGFYLPGLQQATVYIATDGRLAGVAHAAGESAGDSFMAAVQPLHAGRIAGLPGRILVCIAGVALTLLAASGLAMWSLRRGKAAASG